ncbi:unnamed protein product [Amoebophrya sp. A25]|nr:unnamed protein product [Amoebophrya sp. A25]|eukprot:GSA25T00024566001.1
MGRSYPVYQKLERKMTPTTQNLEAVLLTGEPKSGNSVKQFTCLRLLLVLATSLTAALMLAAVCLLQFPRCQGVAIRSAFSFTNPCEDAEGGENSIFLKKQHFEHNNFCRLTASACSSWCCRWAGEQLQVSSPGGRRNCTS